ncbi:uncharacterized protein LOC124939021 [Impatiens glandulifera]|uniref:uncharacterized protein LOC124939021 n=1 Tax=Impatiens glandulifera TaxID=253017 RepID=UPI001FB06B00|nr:uncharacterized protein LOC124939021 [Impatiens glandulifera]
MGERATFCAKFDELCKKINIIDEVEEVRELLAEEVSSRIFLVSNLLELCKEEETGARQRSRATWLRYGDKNTKFFHCVSNAQTRNNVINSISVEGVVHDGEPAISNSIVAFYKELFKESHMTRPKLDGVNFNTINAEQKNSLEARFTEEEVEATIMGCGSDKALGSDGFTLAFFKKAWLFLKIVSKCLANILRGVLESVISANQMTFIKGRQIFDAPLIANECINSANFKRYKCAFVKLDIEKAYDHVNWEF